MPKFLKVIDRFMDACESYIVGYSTIVVAIIMFINVVLRNFFHSGLAWGNEASSYLNILAVCLATGAGFKSGAHVGVSVIVDYVVPKKLRKGVSVITELCVVAFTALVCYESVLMACLQFKQNQLSPVMQVPVGILYVFLAVGMFTSCIRVIMNIVKMFCPQDPPADQQNIANGEEGASC